MGGSVNKVILVGNLGRDPEIRSSQDGKAIANLSLATTESWRDRQSGERREKTEWHRVVIFNEHLAKVAEQYLRKGSQVYIEGQLQTRKWTDQNGVEKYTTEIVLQNFRGELTMLGGGSDQGQGQSGGNQGFGGGVNAGNHGNQGQGGFGCEYRGGGDYGQGGGQSGGFGNYQGGGFGGGAAPADLGDDVPFAPECR